MSRKEFNFLLQQYLEGKCTDEERRFVEHWFGIIQNEERSKLSLDDLKDLEPRMWDRIKSRTGAVPGSGAPKKSLTIWKWSAGIAASILFLVAAIKFYPSVVVQSDPLQTIFQGKTDEWVSWKNQSNEPQQVRLPDGSKALLNPGSTLRYPGAFHGSERQVILTGEAFFEIRRVPDQAFLVYTGNLVTKVLGTSFHIRSSPEKKVSVEVVTGRVAVFESKPGKGGDNTAQREEIILLPNQKVVYMEDSHELITGLVDKPRLIPRAEPATKKTSFVYEDEKMHAVLKQLEDSYGITIKLENELQNDCPLTADLSDLTLFDQLDMICAAIKSSYTVNGTSILISGQGCANLNLEP